VGAQLPQLRPHVVAAVVDGTVEAELVEQPAGLVLATGDADHPAAVQLGYLGGQRPGGAGGGGHHHGLALLHPADVHDPDVGGEPGGAVDGEHGGGVDLGAQVGGQGGVPADR